MAQKTLKCATCSTMIRQDSSSGVCLDCYKKARSYYRPEVQVAADRDKQKTSAEIFSLKGRYAEALKTIEKQESELRSVNVLKQSVDTFMIEPKVSSGKSEGTVVMVASDWHLEEKVGAEVGGLNTFNLDIAKARVERFFQAGLRLTNLLAQDIKIDTVILALLGDFITNNIHEECADVSGLQPMHAITLAKGSLISGITFLLENSSVRLIVPCHSGNHARTTKTTRFSAENGHSLEYLMYLSLADYFRNEPRVQFIIPEGVHSYLDVYGTVIRFQHGHAIKYGGGVGGIFIPAFKAIAQWNKGRHADLDVFGHFHQSKDGGNFLCNGSLIGYNAFALSIKADFETPRQTLFLIDSKRGRTCSWPILVGEK